MAIAQAQLVTWSHQGATKISSDAYATIRHALTKSTSPLASKVVDIYLHGSYANATNTYGDSDIDVVVLYEDTFYKDLSRLTAEAQQVHEAAYGPPSYHWHQLRDDVKRALGAHYGSAAVVQGTKAIKVTTGVGRMTADVVPAVQYRRYARFVSRTDLSAHWGIHFSDAAGNSIVNYPKYHIARGQDKNSAERTGGAYKPTVRIFKNFRSAMIERRYLAQGVAPSYFIECALHNVPDVLFKGEFSATVPAIIDHLMNTKFNSLMAQNGVVALIGEGNTQWSADDFTEYVTSAQRAWTNW